MVTVSSPFGGVARTRVLTALTLLNESYPRELARILDLPISGVQQALRTLERDGLVGSRLMGRTRIVRLEPRYFARKELQAYLNRIARADRALTVRVDGIRRRPRLPGKPL